jgi:uncharacterized membrane protein YccF (DUF307 family)
MLLAGLVCNLVIASIPFKFQFDPRVCPICQRPFEIIKLAFAPWQRMIAHEHRY